MNRQQYESQTMFSAKELSELFDRNLQTVRKALTEGRIPLWTRQVPEGATVSKEDRGRPVETLVHKNDLPTLMERFGAEKLHFTSPGRPRNPVAEAATATKAAPVVEEKRGPGRPKGSKNKVQAAAPEKRGPGRPKGVKDSKPRKQGRWPVKAPQIEVPQVVA